MKAITNQDRAGKFDYHHPRESDSDHQWRGLKRNMRHDDRLDRASAQRLLDKAMTLMTGTQRDRDELRAEFYDRFGQEQQQGVTYVRGQVIDD
jgi:hypothetical protein